MTITFAAEPLTHALLSEALPLLAEHWGEVAHYQDIPLNVDVDALLAVAGSVRCFTARIAPNVAEFVVPHAGYEGDLDGTPVGGNLVGYALFIVRPSLHYKQSLQASQDVIYLHPSVRGGTGSRFIAYCDASLAAEGVQVVYQHAKLAHGQLGGALTRLGYEPVETIYAKRLDGGHTPEVPAGLRAQHAGAAHPWHAVDETNDLARTSKPTMLGALDFTESMQSLAGAHE